MSISLVSIYPTLLGTYGDGGNVMALQHRARLHGLDLEVVQVDPGDPVPESADLYVLGGGEDSAQTAAATALRTPTPGLGILDVRTDRLPKRAVGELAATAKAPLDQILTGYENHAGATHLGADATPLGAVRSGVGNGDGSEGATSGHVIGTYLHGPCLARNPQIADLLLGWATGTELPFIEEPEVTQLREERLRTVLG